MNKKQSEEENDNDWALTVTQDPLHISQAKSGKQGYFCLGCGGEMIANKRKNLTYRSYYRHDPKNSIKKTIECVRASRVYRERLAEQILHRLKKLKVPAVYKLPPNSSEGPPMLVEPAKEVTAHKVKSQLSFYENVLGEIKWGKNNDVKARFLNIVPDITFFDEKGRPILFIEFVVTHKIDDEKKAKLRRFGIDTVQIIIPRKSGPEIEIALKKSNRIKWVYNEKAYNTNYIQPSQGDSSKLLELDEDQRKLFEESFKCRKTQIGFVIRAIDGILESEHYKRIERLFREEISRIEKASDREREGLEGMESAIEQEVSYETEIQFRTEEIQFRTEEKRFEAYNTLLNEKYRELESDFEREKGELEREETEIERAIELAERPGGIEGEIRDGIKSEESRINRELKDVEEGQEDVTRMQRVCEYSAREYRENRERLEAEKREIEAADDNFEQYAREKERRIDREFADLQEQASKRVSERDGTGDTELSRRIEDVLKVRGICSSFSEKQHTFERTKEALEFVRKGSW